MTLYKWDLCKIKILTLSVCMIIISLKSRHILHLDSYHGKWLLFYFYFFLLIPINLSINLNNFLAYFHEERKRWLYFPTILSNNFFFLICLILNSFSFFKKFIYFFIPIFILVFKVIESIGWNRIWNLLCLGHKLTSTHSLVFLWMQSFFQSPPHIFWIFFSLLRKFTYLQKLKNKQQNSPLFI